MTANMTGEAAKKPYDARNLQNAAARLKAAQAVFEHFHTQKPLNEIAKYYIENRLDMTSDGTPDGEDMVVANKALFAKITSGVDERTEDVQSLIVGAQSKQNNLDKEPLLKAILFCATFELLAHVEIDAPIILNDYLNVTHSFFEQGEVNLVNGILDKISKTARD
jgi:N utilization substance protein B